MSKKRLWIIVICLVVSTLVLASYGAAPAAKKGPKYGGHLRFSWETDAGSLDPQLGHLGGDAFYTQQMFDNIVMASDDMVPNPKWSLAESWEFPNPKTIIFKLRKGVKFHDGTDFNAEAAKFNLDRLIDPATAAPFRGSFAGDIETVEAVDEHTLKLNLKKPWAASLSALTLRCIGINSPTAVKKYGKEYGFKPVGTGPFKLVEYIQASHCKVERFKDYWQKDPDGNQLPYLDTVTIRIIPDSAVVSAALRTGELDIGAIPMKDVNKFENIPKINVIKFEGSYVNQLFHFNMAKAPLDNQYLRKALCYGVNPVAVNKAVYFGRHTVAKGGMWPIGGWAYFPDIPERPYFDSEKAKEFLKLGGKPDGFHVEIITSTILDLPLSLEMYKEQLSEIGIDAKITVFDDATKTHKFNVEQAYAVELTAWPLRPEPSIISGYAYKKDGYYNPGHLTPKWLDDLIDKGAATYDFEERKKIYRQVDQYNLDQCHYVPMLYGTTFWGAWQKVKGVEKWRISNGEYTARRLWFEE